MCGMIWDSLSHVWRSFRNTVVESGLAKPGMQCIRWVTWKSKMQVVDDEQLA